jgi:carbohydrate kinase (thermoresistant glucokinase family)
MIYLVMGVSGSGKTLIGTLLAKKMNLPFYDADDFHSQRNIRKMRAGIALTDKDRTPWLKAVCAQIPMWRAAGGAVLACSALKERYRDRLRLAAEGEMRVIHLTGSPELIGGRMRRRAHPFFHAGLLSSQYEALEPPERAVTVSVDNEPGRIVREILERLKARKNADIY